MEKIPSERLFVVLTFASVFLIILNLYEPFRFLKEGYLRTVSPVTRIISFPSDEILTISERSHTYINLLDKNKEMQNRISKLEKKLGRLEYLEMILEVQSKEEEHTPAIFSDALPARLLLSSPEDYMSTFILSRGSTHGVFPDDTVGLIHMGEWVLAGRIEATYPNYSKVLLITSNEFRCSVITEKGFRGVLRGNNRWELILDYLSPEAELRAGERVYTDGSGGIIPEGLLVGEITGWDTLEFSTGKRAVLKPFYTPQNARRVYVLK